MVSVRVRLARNPLRNEAPEFGSVLKNAIDTKPMRVAAVVKEAGCTTVDGASDDVAALAIVWTWRQLDAACGVAQPVRELIFEADGHYSVTWLPFETYKDYWGRYRCDPHSRALSLTVEAGNYNPPDGALAGEVRVEDHPLTLSDVSLGAPQNGELCFSAVGTLIRFRRSQALRQRHSKLCPPRRLLR